MTKKISDLILARPSSFVGTAEYVSPELLNDKITNKSSDWWAFGCILYHMLAGRPPFRAMSEFLIFQKVSTGKYEFPKGFPEVIKDLVSKLLVTKNKREKSTGLHLHSNFDILR